MGVEQCITLVILELQDKGVGQQRQGWQRQFEADANLGSCKPEVQVTSDRIHLSIIKHCQRHTEPRH